MMTSPLNLSRILPGHPLQEDVCLQRLADLLRSKHGVEHVHLSAIGRGVELRVDHDPNRISLRDLERVAREAGAEVQARFRHETLGLVGLHCTDCATSIEAVTGRLAGVHSVNVSFGTEKAQLVFDPSLIDRPAIEREIKSLGYRIREEETGSQRAGENVSQVHAGDSRVLGVSPQLALSLVAGLALATGWVGELFFGAPRWVSLPLYLAAYLTGGWDATKHAVRAALKRRFDIDILMVVAALGAASLGAWAEGALLLFLFSLGHALENYAMDRARGAIRALAELTPKTARVRRDGREQEIAVTDLLIGDVVIVRPGERLPADGRVLKGASSVDQAPITGESLPVAKEAGEAVFAGTINGDGALEVETTKAPEDTTLARVIQAVENAQSAKAPSHRFTDRFQRTFTPVILAVTALVIAVPPLLGVPFSESFIRAMTLLVAASPCALALATPSAILAGIARAARSGVLIKGGVYLENAGTADVVVFDKTGTLTKGRPEVTDIVDSGPLGEDEVLRLAAALETRSGHPLAAAIVAAAEARGLELPEVEMSESLTGKGLRGSVAGSRVLVGNDKLMRDASLAVPPALEQPHEALQSAGKTSLFVAVDSEVVGLIAVRDEPRDTARAAIAALKRQGVKHVVMLTGDNARVAEAVGLELGLDEVGADLLPEDKAARVEALRERYGKVIMVGDGVNDAPAMAVADVGIAMGGAGTDVALETADIALMADDLSKLPYAVSLSRATRRMIVQNLAISLGVIALLVPSALLGLASIGIAIVLHESSTLVVVANALRLLGYRARASA
ncbi:MAG: cadmium-translocating P-type ATPase [Trueperaceae bacterium]|nr:cadmium-translocating P-type ATPase [Trueperaceae bacterium]